MEASIKRKGKKKTWASVSFTEHRQAGSEDHIEYVALLLAMECFIMFFNLCVFTRFLV